MGSLSSLTRSLDRGCGSKRAYPSRHVANGMVRVHSASHPGDLRRLDCYKCRTCGKWHIGHAQLRRDRPVLMSHEDRRKLIEASFVCNLVGQRAWSGVTYIDNVPVNGRRMPRRSYPGFIDAEEQL